MKTSNKICFSLNGREYSLEIDPARLLIDFLRDDLGLKGTKPGCLEGECGACTVLVNGEAINSCLYLAVNIDGKTLETIESLDAVSLNAEDPVEAAIINHGAVQCGFCTPGMVMAIKGFQKECADASITPTRDQIKRGLEGNLCRCTGYVKIIDAAQSLFEEDK